MSESYAIPPDKVWALDEIKRLRNLLWQDAAIHDALGMPGADLDDERKAAMVQVFYTVGEIQGLV